MREYQESSYFPDAVAKQRLMYKYLFIYTDMPLMQLMTVWRINVCFFWFLTINEKVWENHAVSNLISDSRHYTGF